MKSIYSSDPCLQSSGSCHYPPTYGAQAFWSLSEPQGEAVQAVDVPEDVGVGAGGTTHKARKMTLQQGGTSKESGHRDRGWNPGSVSGSVDK